MAGQWTDFHVSLTDDAGAAADGYTGHPMKKYYQQVRIPCGYSGLMMERPQSLALGHMSLDYRRMRLIATRAEEVGEGAGHGRRPARADRMPGLPEAAAIQVAACLENRRVEFGVVEIQT